jgi:hypothetical protein
MRATRTNAAASANERRARPATARSSSAHSVNFLQARSSVLLLPAARQSARGGCADALVGARDQRRAGGIRPPRWAARLRRFTHSVVS